MYLIRQAEETIRAHYVEDEMKTPMHLSVGAEAIASGVIGALQPTDQVFGTYRSHGIYLAKTEETDIFFGELLGRETGRAKGKAGSMHLAAPEDGLLLTSAVVGTTIPIAVGAAFANVYQDNGKFVVAFFGDGALEEGIFWESINLACLKRVPILFVCEDNDLAIHTKKKDRQSYTSITNIVSQFGCSVEKSESTDVEEIYRLTCKSREQSQRENMPSFLHLRYYRYYEHVGIRYDFNAGYRSEEEFQRWQKIDPLFIQRQRLVQQGHDEDEIARIELAIRTNLEDSFQRARRAPLPDPRELWSHVYAE